VQRAEVRKEEDRDPEEQADQSSDAKVGAYQSVLQRRAVSVSALARPLLSDRDVESLCALKPGMLAASEAAPVALRNDVTEAKIYQFPQPALHCAPLHTEENGDRL
jgi:hypothetical protein